MRLRTPIPTPVFRMTHIENLSTLLERGALHASNCSPSDGLPYRTIHNVDIQQVRSAQRLDCGPRGVIHDYVPFYFGPRSPMLLQLHTGRVEGFGETQGRVIYLVSCAQDIAASGASFVFSDGHGIAAYTRWFDDLAHLGEVNWDIVYADYWYDNADHMDRQRRKQAEFLVYQTCEWRLIAEIGVIDVATKSEVEAIIQGHPHMHQPPVNVHREWYY